MLDKAESREGQTTRPQDEMVTENKTYPGRDRRPSKDLLRSLLSLRRDQKRK